MRFSSGNRHPLYKILSGSPRTSKDKFHVDGIRIPGTEMMRQDSEVGTPHANVPHDMRVSRLFAELFGGGLRASRKESV